MATDKDGKEKDILHQVRSFATYQSSPLTTMVVRMRKGYLTGLDCVKLQKWSLEMMEKESETKERGSQRNDYDEG